MAKVTSFVIADKVEDQVLCLKRLSADTVPYEDMDVHMGTLSDKSGEIRAYISHERYNSSMLDLVSGAVLITGLVLNGKNMEPIVKIKSLRAAESGTFKPSEIFDGLDEEHVAKYIATMKYSLDKISDEEIRRFTEGCLTDDAYRGLAARPASLAYHGTYRGGALACAASVTKMVCQTGWQYQKFNCGLYKPVFDWSIAIAAGLLSTYGVLGYYTEAPYKKTPSGVQRGYMSILQALLQRVYQAHPMTPDKFDRLLNALSCSVPMKSGVKATGPEGMLIRHVLMLYEELDMFDASVAGHEPKEGETYYYDPKLRRTVPVAQPEEEGGAA